MNIKPIKTEQDYRATLIQIESLMMAKANTPEGDALDVLVTLVEAYERQYYALPLPDPIEAVKFEVSLIPLMEKINDLLASLPVRVAKAEPLACSFLDSTHALWRLETLDARTLFLKVVQNTSSPFWQIMQQVFALNLSQRLGDYHQLYRQVSELTPIQIPDLIACAAQSRHCPAYLLTAAVSGNSVKLDQVNDEMVVALARHLAGLHKAGQTTWGLLL